jgi:dihydrofolate reductase
MRKLISYLHASLDGFVQGMKEFDLGWISYDEALENYAKEILSTVDTVLWGRATYLGMQSYWPTVPANPESTKYELEHAAWLDKTQKIVASKTLEDVDWTNTKLIKNNLSEEVTKVKQEAGKDIIMLGSPGLTHSLTQLGLIDEYRININPIVIGDGLPLFKVSKDRIGLKLLSSKIFNSGVIGLHYEVKKGEER